MEIQNISGPDSIPSGFSQVSTVHNETPPEETTSVREEVPPEENKGQHIDVRV